MESLQIGGKKPSEEQRCILTTLGEGGNCVSDSVPGGGKSTTCYFIALLFPTLNILNLTFSKDLKEESRRKIEGLKITNMDVESYHSFAHNYYGMGGMNTEELYKIINENTPAILSKIYDLIILDEMQDMSMVFYKLISKYCKDVAFNPQYLIIGDKYQCVFKFKGADIRFLTRCEDIFNRKFIDCPLTISRRLTDPISRFMNDVILNEPRIRTDKPGKKVRYLIGNPYDEEFVKLLVRAILKHLGDGYKPDDIFVLAPSLNPRTPITILNKLLSNHNVNILWADNVSESGLTHKHMKNKIVMTTFHKSKGRERPICIAYGMDESFYHYGRDTLSKDICPEPVYVALTRPLEYLYIIHGHDKDSSDKKFRKMPFIKKPIRELNNEYCTVWKSPGINYEDLEYGNNREIVNNSENKFIVTDFIKHISDTFEKELLPYINMVCTIRHNRDNGIKIKTDIIVGDKTESISDLNGIAIPALWEFRLNGEMSIYKIIQSNSHRYKKGNAVRKHIDGLRRNSWDIYDTLKIANVYKSITSETYHNLNQVEGFDWISKRQIDLCMSNLDEIITDKKLVFEKTLHYYYNHRDYGKIEFTGIIDAVNLGHIYEFKCVNELTSDHKLQAIMYGWLWNKINPNDFKHVCLFNILTCEIIEIDYKNYRVDDIIEILIHNKLKDREEVDDSDFISMCLDEKAQILEFDRNYTDQSECVFSEDE